MFDQLLYTWAGRRPGHDSGFQVIAATGRLAHEGDAKRRAAVRLCRYPLPRGLRTTDLTDMPVAYGWIDHGDTRFIFRRTYAGTDLLGRPGNFYAHVIAGPPILGPAAIAERFGSSFWWRGEDLDEYLSGARTLQPAALDEIPPGVLPDVDQKQLAALCESLLTPAAPLPHVLDVTPPAAAALLNAAAQVLPRVLDRMPYSTYESPQTASQFAIVTTAGMVGKPANATVVPAHPVSSTPTGIRRARELALSSKPAEQDIVRMSLFAATLPHGGVDINRLTDLVAIFDNDQNTAALRVETLQSVLTGRESATIFLQHPRALEAVANRLIMNHTAVWDTLRSTAPSLPAATLQELGAAVGAGVSVNAPHAVGEILQQATTCPSAFTQACAEAVLIEAAESPTLLTGVDGDTIFLLVSAAAQSEVHSDDVVTRLLRSPEAYPRTATSQTIPAKWRAVAMAAELTRNAAHAGSIAAHLRAEPPLAPLVAAAVGRHQPLIDVMSLLPLPHALPLTLCAGTKLREEERYRLWRWLIPQLPLDTRVQTLLQHTRWIDPAAEPRWVRLIASTTHSWISQGYLTGRTTIAPNRVHVLIRQCPAGMDSWLDFLDQFMTGHLTQALAGDREKMHQALADLARIDDPTRRGTAVELGLVAAVGSPRHDQSLCPLVRRLAQLHPGGYGHVASRLLVLGQRFSSRPDRNATAIQCLSCVAELISSGELRTWPNGSLRHRDTQRLAVQLAERIRYSDLTAAAARLKQTGGHRAALRWWRTIAVRPE